MMENIRKLPIGVQDFEKLREEGFLYVDKTEYIYQLVRTGSAYFLSRPRRFGKSLLLSTMRAYFEGKRELFRGLKIEELEGDGDDAWIQYPVFYFDLNKDNYLREGALEDVLASHLAAWEEIYGDKYSQGSLAARFQHLIEMAVKQTGRNAVVLVDEYDKPLLETMDVSEQEEHNKNVFKGFFSTLKSYDHYLKFVFVTGVTKFSKVSIFSDLNQLRDISSNRDHANICGISEEEIRQCLMPEVETMAHDQEIDVGECLDRLKQMYDGYRFHWRSEGVYNPLSLLSALADREFDNYWFSTGTPTFLVNKILSENYDLSRFTDGTLYAKEASLKDYRVDDTDPVPLLFQTGYLTIKGYDRKYRSYELGYPNDEVKYSFIESLAKQQLSKDSASGPLDIRSFCSDIENGTPEALENRFRAVFSRLPYTTDERPLEQNFQNVIYIVFMLMGQYVKTEVHSAKGRADCIVETDSYIYIFEFKRDGSAEEALAQIATQGYALPYAADERKLFKIGVNFDSEKRTITEWRVG